MKPTLPTGWRWVALGSLLSRHKDLMNPSDEPDRQFNSVGLEDIGGDGSGTIHVQQVNGTDLASSKARFAKGDLLYGRMRPYLNKVAIAPSVGVCSTEIWVLHPKDVIETEYAFWILTSRYFLRRVERVTEGANLPRADADGFDRIDIPVPPLSEQRRIVEILNEAGDIRRLRQQADDLTAKLIPAIFHDMFGDPTTVPPDWPLVSVDSVRLDGKTTIRTGPFGSDLKHDEFVEKGIPVIAIDNVVTNRFRWVPDRCVTPEKYEGFKRFRVFPRDVLVTIMGTVGRACVTPADLPECMSTKHLCVITVDEVKMNPYFLWATLLYDARIDVQTRGAGHGAIMQGWNSTIIRKLRFHLPPKELQDQFESVVRDVLSTEEAASQSTKLQSSVTASLLAHAFSGELTSEWREANHELLEQEAAERDEWLREAGVKLTVTDTKIEVKTKDQDERHAELNREQHELLNQIQLLELDDSAGTFTLSTLTDSLAEPLDKLSVATVRRHLDVLAARGLVKSLSRRAGAGGSIDVAFGNAYRLPKNDKQAAKTDAEPDEVRMSELDRLSRQGRVFHETVTSELSLSGTAEVSVTKNEGDE